MLLRLLVGQVAAGGSQASTTTATQLLSSLLVSLRPLHTSVEQHHPSKVIVDDDAPSYDQQGNEYPLEQPSGSDTEESNNSMSDSDSDSPAAVSAGPAGDEEMAAASTSAPSHRLAASSAQQEETGSSSSSRRHLGLDDPALNIYLRYNTKFITDPDREYAIGQVNSQDKKNRLELRKALAAHRLQLQDASAASAASGQRQRSLSQQMSSRIADMQNYLANTVGR